MASKSPNTPPLLLYAITAANLYGTERVAIATLAAFAKERAVVLIAPPGPAVDLARSKGIQTLTYISIAHKAALLFKLSWQNPSIRFITISVVDSYLYSAVRLVQLKPPRHLHIIHGSGFPARSYQSKRYLNWMPVDIYAVSDYTKARLCEFGVKPHRVRVIENFVTEADLEQARIRTPYEFGKPPVKVVVISRVEKPKRVDLVLDALEQSPDLAKLFQFEIYGAGPELAQLESRAKKNPNASIVFHGFQPNVSSRICNFDLLLHLCPIEPFGIIYLEAMSAGVVAVGPDEGSKVIAENRTGFLFKANNADSLAQTLMKIRGLSAESLNRIVQNARDELATRYSERRALHEYRQAIDATY